MLGVFLARAGINRSINGLNDDVRRAAVFLRVPELELELFACEHLIDEQGVGIGIKVGGDRSGLGLIRQPDKRDIVVHHDGIGVGVERDVLDEF